MFLAEDRFDSLIAWYAARFHRDPRQVKRQIRRESAFDPNACSGVGARGLAQFMETTWAEWCDGRAGIDPPPPSVVAKLTDPRDPEDGIMALCAYMAQLERSLGTLMPALAAYNAGIGRVRRLMREAGPEWPGKLPQETRDYLVFCLDYDRERLVVVVD